MKALEEWLPKDKWKHINPMLVDYGKTVCKPLGPRCWECPIKHLCPMTGKTKEPKDTKKSPQSINTAEKKQKSK